MHRFFAAAALCLSTVLLSIEAAAAPPQCTLMAVDKAERAKIKVYFTKFIKEDNTGGKFKSCRIVSKADADTVTFFVTPFRQDATAVVHESNWPK